MEALYKPLLYLHIIGGTCGLFFSVLALIVRKGGLLHRRFGMVFYVGMLATGISSLCLAVLHPNPFLGGIGIFSLYMALVGMRAVRWRHLLSGQKPWQDACMQLGMLLGSAGMYGLAFYYTLGKEPTIPVVLTVFGTVALFMAWQDYRTIFWGRRSPQFWLRTHVQRMMGATISAYTAFAVVNFELLHPLPPLVLWLGPSVLGTVVITYWMRKLAQKSTPIYQPTSLGQQQ